MPKPIDRTEFRRLETLKVPTKKMALLLGCHEDTITKLRREQNLLRNGRRLWTYDEIALAKKRFAEGWTVGEVGIELNRAPEVVARKFPDHVLTREERNERIALYQQLRKLPNKISQEPT